MTHNCHAQTTNPNDRLSEFSLQNCPKHSIQQIKLLLLID